MKVTDLGDADWFLGVRILRSAPDGDVQLDQKQYLTKAMKSLDIDTARSVVTPCEPAALSVAVRNPK